MKTLSLLPYLGLLLVPSLAPVQLCAEETTAELVATIDRLSQKIPSPAFQQTRKFQTPSRHGEYMDISADGSRMVMIQRDKKFSTWNVDEGKKLAEFTAEDNGIDGVLKISRDGKWIAFANQRKFIEVHEVETGKLVHKFDLMDWKIGDVGFSQDSQLLYANGTQRQLLIAHPDGEVIKHESEAILDKERRVRMCNFGKDCWATVVEHVDKNFVELIWEMPNDQGRYELPLRNAPNIVGGPDSFCVFSGAEFWAGPNSFGGVFHSTTQQWIRDIRIDSLENTEQAHYAWISTWSGAEVRGAWSMGQIGQIIVPRKYDSYAMQIPAPNAKRLINQGPGGRTTIYDLGDAEIRPSAYRTTTILDMVMRQKRYDVINELGKLWENRLDPITDSKLTTAYSELMYHVSEFRDAPRNAEEQAQWLAELVAKHPDNDLLRLALANKYYSIGVAARGDGYAYKVTPEGWATLEEQMQKCWDTIEPMLERDHVPPEVFVKIVGVARHQGWSRDRLDPYLERALREAPTYHRIWQQECMSRLPRWGGAPGETEALAAKVADQIGGKEGDILYAETARLIYIFYGWTDLFEEGGYDKDRVVRGMVALCERAPDTYAENQALLLAREIDDHAAAHQIATLWTQRNHTYIHRLWKWDLKEVEETLAWAMADAPPEKKEAEPEEKDAVEGAAPGKEKSDPDGNT